VVHLAAISHVVHNDLSAYYKVNVAGSAHLLEAVLATGHASKILLASSANIYGNCDASPITEKQLPAPVNHYAVSKLAMEYMAKTYSDKLPIVVARPFNYTGPGHDKAFLIPKLVHHFVTQANQVSLGNLHVMREFNDVRMVAQCYLDLIQNGIANEAYNICTGQAYSLQTVISQLEQLSGQTIEVVVNPAFVRANEVHRLCGDPSKLLTASSALEQYTLSDTLSWMLKEAIAAN
jgi:nucleoside-diphosphate-sugar epimerase